MKTEYEILRKHMINKNRLVLANADRFSKYYPDIVNHALESNINLDADDDISKIL